MTGRSATAALITAAGLSSRMQAFKPLLPLGGQSIIGRQIETLRRAGCAPIVVVTGHRAGELRRHLRKYAVEFVHNAAYRDTQMLDSIRIGLAHLNGRCDSVILTPVDVPLFSVRTVQTLLRTPALAAIPTYHGRAGHPIALRAPLFDCILHTDAPGGLRDILRLHAADLARVPVRDEAILPDVDTPSDYMALLLRFGLTGGTPQERIGSAYDTAQSL